MLNYYATAPLYMVNEIRMLQSPATNEEVDAGGEGGENGSHIR